MKFRLIAAAALAILGCSAYTATAVGATGTGHHFSNRGHHCRDKGEQSQLRNYCPPKQDDEETSSPPSPESPAAPDTTVEGKTETKTETVVAPAPVTAAVRADIQVAPAFAGK